MSNQCPINGRGQMWTTSQPDGSIRGPPVCPAVPGVRARRSVREPMGALFLSQCMANDDGGKRRDGIR
jgi:hypothetical protein